jgi:hypothetical protein
MQAASNTLRALHQSFTGRDFQHRHHISAARDAESSRSSAVLTGPDVDYVLASNRHQTLVEVERIAKEILAEYRTPDGLAVIVVAGQQDGLMRDLRTDIASCSSEIPVVSQMAAKGQEYLAGIVVDAISYQNDPAGAPGVESITIARYRLMSGLYVAISRFRDRLTVISSSASSPAWPNTKEGS